MPDPPPLPCRLCRARDRPPDADDPASFLRNNESLHFKSGSTLDRFQSNATNKSSVPRLGPGCTMIELSRSKYLKRADRTKLNEARRAEFAVMRRPIDS